MVSMGIHRPLGPLPFSPPGSIDDAPVRRGWTPLRRCRHRRCCHPPRLPRRRPQAGGQTAATCRTTKTMWVTGGEVVGEAVPAADGQIAAAHHGHGCFPWRRGRPRRVQTGYERRTMPGGWKQGSYQVVKTAKRTRPTERSRRSELYQTMRRARRSQKDQAQRGLCCRGSRSRSLAVTVRLVTRAVSEDAGNVVKNAVHAARLIFSGN